MEKPEGKTSLIQSVQEESSIFWEVTVSVIISKKLYINICPIPNSFGCGKQTVILRK